MRAHEFLSLAKSILFLAVTKHLKLLWSAKLHFLLF